MAESKRRSPGVMKASISPVVMARMPTVRTEAWAMAGSEPV
ncbi:hypothetical protein [Propionicimonas sp.]